MAIDLSEDFPSLDNLEKVTLDMSIGGVSQVYDPGAATIGALRLPDLLVERDPSDGGVLQRQTEWHLPTTVAVIDPRPDDKITDGDAIEWVIQSIRRPFAGDYWGLTCIEATITADDAIAVVVTLYPCEHTTDEWGATVTTHLVEHADFHDVAAKIVLRPSVVQDRAGQREYIEIYDVYVDEALPQLYNGDILRQDGGKDYTITSWRNRQNIEELSVIVCEIRPRP